MPVILNLQQVSPSNTHVAEPFLSCFNLFGGGGGGEREGEREEEGSVGKRKGEKGCAQGK